MDITGTKKKQSFFARFREFCTALSEIHDGVGNWKQCFFETVIGLSIPDNFFKRFNDSIAYSISVRISSVSWITFRGEDVIFFF